MAAPEQLSLGVTLNDDATFDSFYAPEGSGNAQILAILRAQLGGAAEPLVYLWGATGSGLSHLLQACCLAAQDRGLNFQYLPLAELADFEPAALCEGLEVMAVCAWVTLAREAGSTGWNR